MNIAEILRKCPNGTKLYSPVYGEVELTKVDYDKEYPITCITENGFYGFFTSDGMLYCDYSDAECMLFPSRDQRDWSKFEVTDQATDQKQETELKPFDKVLVRDSDDRKWVCDFFEGIPTSSEYEYSCVLRGLVYQCIPYEGNEHLLGTTNKQQ